MAYAYKRGGRIWLGYKDARGHPVREPSTAMTITEGRRLALELEQRCERVRLGLELPPPPPTTFAALAERYLAEVASQKRSVEAIESRVRLHLVPELGRRLISEIRAGDIEGLLARKGKSERNPKGLSPQSLEHLRIALSSMFAFALRAGLLRDENPVAKVPKRKIPESEIRFLEPQVVARVVAEVPARWRNLFATAVLTGARRGELFALRPGDVDLAHRTLTLSRSHGGSTKSGKTRVVPIPAELVPFLEAALMRARGGLLFPSLTGGMLSRHTDLAPVLRRALVRAKVIDHWSLRCRRKTCGYREDGPSSASRPCPKCGFALWPIAVPPDLQFRHLRSTWGTFACEATGDIRFAQAGLGHSDSRVTERHYAAIRARHMVAQADKIRFGLEAPDLAATHNWLTTGSQRAPKRRTRRSTRSRRAQ